MEIPPGVDTGDGLRINAHHQVEVYVAPSSQFTRDGSNIFSRVRVGLAQAVLGGTVVVPGLYGDIQLKV